MSSDPHPDRPLHHATPARADARPDHEDPAMMHRTPSRRFSLRPIAAAVAAATLLATAPCAVLAQEITLRAVNGFQEGTYPAKNFEAWVKKVNADCKGSVQVNYIGGPKAIPTFEQANALRNGVVDLAHTTASFTASVTPEVLALNYTNLSTAEMRRTGVFDYMNQILGEKNLYYYAMTAEGMNYHLYLNKPIKGVDLSGLKIRSTPLYNAFFQKLGASTVQMAPGEVYTALERGVVDGYGWPLMGLFDLGWQEKTKFRVDPGFFQIEQGIQFNAKVWANLNAQQKACLETQRQWLETNNAAIGRADTASEYKKQADAGVQTIRLDDASARTFARESMNTAWDSLIKTTPVHGAKLRQMLEPK